MHGNLSIERTVPHGVTRPLERHPSFPDGMPAIIAEPVPVGYCEVCAWLAGRIRAGRHTEDYGLLALRHWYAIHEPDAVTTLQTRHTGGAS